MNVKKVSPLGVFFIGFFVKFWNQSTDQELKNSVRANLRSDLGWQVNNGLIDLCRIADKLCGLVHVEVTGVQDFWCLLASILGSGQRSMPRQDTREIYDVAKGDIAFHFDAMFKAGYFEQIPLPEFSYGVPDPKAEEIALKTAPEDANPDQTKIASPEPPYVQGHRSDVGAGGHDDD